ncbi:MAG TPA: DUF1573 domain-containing protein [Chthoniobacterales bacterium]|nr:DUF1573 domain-containing protein [Chthoniobacterales bacterium]
MKTRILTLIAPRRALPLCIGGSILLAVAARADLKWEQNTIELHPAVGDKQAVAHFKYENTGKTPIHFKSVRASCGCTATQTQKEVVNPGEKGEVTATFTIGDRTGQQVKTVTVQTDDPDPTKTTTILTLKTNITPPMEIKPTFVYWTSGEKPTPKKVTLKAAKEFPAKNITVKSNNQNFDSKVVPGKPGEWTIEITPKDTSHAMGTALLVQADYPKEAPKSFYVNAQITQPQPPPLLRAPATQSNPPVTQPNAPTSKAATPAAIPSPATH